MSNPFMALRFRYYPILLVTLFLSSSFPACADWPDYRGPWGDGHLSAPGSSNLLGLPLHWSETNNLKWKTPIPYRGWSTPAILGNQIWLTTATEDGHDYFVLCVDADSGKIIYNEKFFHRDVPEPLGNNMNGYATPSPVIEPGRVYVHFGSVGTACLDTATMKLLWTRDDLKCRHYRGASSSPVLFENLLILTFDGADLQYLAALDKNTGKTVWKTDRSVAWNDEDVPGKMAKEGDQRKAHSTPLITNVHGKPQLLSGGAKAAYGYDPRTGREIWKVRYNDWSVAPRPVFDGTNAYIVTGLGMGELWAVRPDGEGDVTDTHVVWKNKSRTRRYASPLLVDGLLYSVADESFVTCLDTTSGQAVWTERIGGKYSASPIYADGRIYFFSQEGVTTVLKPGRTYLPIATNMLDCGFMACPAVCGAAFYLRTKTDLCRIEASSTVAP
jgi:outer membrane protein assembly factor BamB